jgi:hypothetical protein
VDQQQHEDDRPTSECASEEQQHSDHDQQHPSVCVDQQQDDDDRPTSECASEEHSDHDQQHPSVCVDQQQHDDDRPTTESATESDHDEQHASECVHQQGQHAAQASEIVDQQQQQQQQHYTDPSQCVEDELSSVYQQAAVVCSESVTAPCVEPSASVSRESVFLTHAPTASAPPSPTQLDTPNPSVSDTSIVYTQKVSSWSSEK